MNDNGVFDSGTDIIVNDAQWIGTPLVSNDPFVVPAGCNFLLSSAPGPSLGIRVIAPKITIIGSVQILTSGGRGIVLIADPAKVPAPGLGDGSITIGSNKPGSLTKVFAGGVDTFIHANFPTAPAIDGRSIAIWAATECTFNNADVEGTVPTGSTEIGILCGNDAVFRGTTVRGSRVNIQSLTGVIDARSFAPLVAGNLGDFCDDPIKNTQGGAGAPGNGDGVSNAGDFPCTLDFNALAGVLGVKTFPDQNALLAFCGATGVGGPNTFQAVNDPLIMIAQKDLDLRGAPGGGGDTVLQAHTRITLGSVTGNVLASNTQINTIIPGGTPANGAFIEIGATPTTVNRLPVDREDLIGPATGTLTIGDACLFSVPAVKVLNGMAVTGTPDPAPCKQFPAGFQFVPQIVH